MSRSKDKTNCRTQKHSRASFLSFAPKPWIQKDITHLYQEKLSYIILYKAPFYKKKKSAHKTQMCVRQLYVSSVKNHFKATI